MKNKNLFIVIEGLDGSGKSTITKKLSHKLNCTSYKTPSIPFNDLRSIIDESKDCICRFLFYLTTVCYASFEIKKLLTQNHVICDRYLFSTIAYHYCMNPDLKKDQLNFLKESILKPDFSFYLEADYETRMERICKREKLQMNIALADKLNHKEFNKQVEEEFRRFENLIYINTEKMSPEQIVESIIREIK
jgi:dTMP kinase